MSLKLHAPVGNPRANKILIAAKIANQPVEFVHVAYDKLEVTLHFTLNRNQNFWKRILWARYQCLKLLKDILPKAMPS